MANKNVEKKSVSQEMFDKRVDIERAHLQWIDRMFETEARTEATRRVSAEYEVDQRLRYPD